VQAEDPSPEYVPAAHTPETAVKNTVAQYEPPGHWSHELENVLLWYLPTAHSVQAVDPAMEYLPDGHGIMPEPPVVGQKEPALQREHAERPVPGAYCPAAQELHATDALPEAYLPRLQGEHTEAAACEEYVPAVQSTHAAPSKNCPAAH
jgi:hypothetical protein